MKMDFIKKAAVTAVLIMVLALIFISQKNYLLNRYSIPDKEERLYNLRVYSGINDLNELDSSDIANDIHAALEKYTNWDNLFLSENFKKKYKNRRNILDDVDNISAIHSGLDHEFGGDSIVILAEKKHGIFDTDESDNITTEYHFRYVLNKSGEIDDLVLLKKQDIYTMSGEPVDGNESYGWQE